jgi:hypothetical protein
MQVAIWSLWVSPGTFSDGREVVEHGMVKFHKFKVGQLDTRKVGVVSVKRHQGDVIEQSDRT